MFARYLFKDANYVKSQDDDNQKLHRKRVNFLPYSSRGAIVAVTLLLLGFLLFNKEHLLSTKEYLSSSSSTSSASKLETIPSCEASPWKADEDMVGTCPGIQKVKDDTILTARQCADSCCAKDDCITWQFRSDKGCLQGKDVRIGMEKDGPSAYCSDHPPLRWQGQFTKDDEAACSPETWKPNSQPGQCFGLGDVRKGIDSAEDCMKTCCSSSDQCGAWQFHSSLGCFYGKSMFSCQKSDDPIVFEPFVGRRKYQKDRTYSGPERGG